MSSGTQTDLDWAVIDAGNSASGAAIPGGTNGGDAKHSGFASMTDEEILGIGPPSPNGGFGGLARLDVATGAGAQENDRARLDATSRDELASGQTGFATPMPAWLQALTADPKVGAEAQQMWSEHQAFRAAFSSPDEARVVADETRALRELLPGGAQEVQALRQIAQEVDSLRAVAREAESLRQNSESVREATASVERIDAAIFSGDARAQSEVVAEIARVNPAAFRSMFAEAAKVLAGMGNGGARQGTAAANTAGWTEVGGDTENRHTLRNDGEGWGTRNANLRHNSTQHQHQNPNSNQSQNVNSNENQNRNTDSPDVASSGRGIRESSLGRSTVDSGTNRESPVANHQSQVTNQQSQSGQSRHFDPAAYASFERTTNDVVARDVRGSINDTLTRVLPEGVADGAAKRIGEDIFNEVHRALAADRALSEQVGEVLRDRRFGNAEQQRVAALLTGRAKQLVPSVARRVIGEWTSSVLGTARTKAARQAAAASRVDIAAPGRSMDSTPLRAMSAREVNYASMSDDDILGM